VRDRGLRQNRQDAIAAGTRFDAGQTVRSGWRTLRLIERPDGMLGLEERIAGGRWAEQVDLTVRDLWLQRQVASGLGLADWIAFPADGQHATVAECVDETVPSVLLSREHTDDPDFSGWTVSCPALTSTASGMRAACGIWPSPCPS
jgi:hypothetical protein